jgi:hypothetical protein|tara:strand:+ start:607 stop:843 length:237 start_codon:yes stop_codon:yes gene_type:complete
VSGWNFKWSTGQPKDDGLYMACWLQKDEGQERVPFYALLKYKGGWNIPGWSEAPDYWMEVTPPSEDFEQMKEYENATT